MSPIEIHTERLLLREPRPDDAEPLHAVFGDPLAMRYVGDGSTRDLDQIRRSIEMRLACQRDHTVTLLTVVEKATGTIIGDCGVFPIDWTHPEFELGYRYRASSWGNGYATEAARAVMRWAWQVTSLETIYGVTLPGNDASQNVLRKTGFRDLGTTDRFYGMTLRFFECDRPSPDED